MYWLEMVSKASSLCTMAPNTRGCREETVTEPMARLVQDKATHPSLDWPCARSTGDT